MAAQQDSIVFNKPHTYVIVLVKLNYFLLLSLLKTQKSNPTSCLDLFSPVR